MHDDERMDDLLRTAMAATPPQLSPGFDARVMRRVRPRRLTRVGRVVMAVYIVVAAAATAWLLRDLPLTSIVAAIGIGAPIAVATGFYGRYLAGLEA